MPNFDLIYQAAKDRNAKKISLLRLKYRNNGGDEIREFALTPAGQFAKEGDWETALWFMSECRDSVESILYGAVLGGHIKSLPPELDSPPEGLKLICSKSSDDTQMLKAFAQIGELKVISEYFENPQNATSSNVSAAVYAAAYGNQIAVLDYLLKNFKSMEEALSLEVIEAAAWGGHETLLLDSLAQYRLTNKYTLPHKLTDKVLVTVMRGCGSGGQLGLITSLQKKGFELPDSYFYDAFRRAATYNQDDFILASIKKRPELKCYAIYALAVSRRVDLFESLNHEKNHYAGIAIFMRQMITSGDSLCAYLICFNKSDFVEQLCQVLIERKEIDAEIIKQIPDIKKRAFAIIDLKNRYGLTTKQARFLYEYPIVQDHINKKQSHEKIYELLKEQTNLLLDSWQFMDMVKRISKNKEKSQLIDDLTGYLDTKTSWWYNHRKRCESFLETLKSTKSHKGCVRLVAEQFRLFSPDQKTNEPENLNVSKHELPVQQTTLKDDYFEAIKKFHDACPESKVSEQTTGKSFS